MSQTPKAFISYSWDSEEHKVWVRELATRLRRDGIEVTLDQWHAVPGDQLPAFMERAVRETNFVLLICTPKYKFKADQRSGGVGYEGDIMTAEIFTQHDQRKFIPILRLGEWGESAPSSVLGKYYIDLRQDPYSADAYRDLVSTLKGQRPQPPPVGIDSAPLESDIGAVVEFAALSDLLVSEISYIQYAGYTFGESQRILAFVSQLHKLLKSRIAIIEDSLGAPVLATVQQFYSLVGKYTSEAKFVLPIAGDDKYTKDTEILKMVRYHLVTTWDILKKNLLFEDRARVAYEKLRNEGDALWQIAGYQNEKAYRAYLSPNTEDMLKSAKPIELALVTAIVEKVQVTESDLVEEGFPRNTVVETLNSLMRDGYLKTEGYEIFHLTPLGIKILKDLLAQRHKKHLGSENAGYR